MIRQQQAQLQQLQHQQQNPHQSFASTTAVIDNNSTPTSERSGSVSIPTLPPARTPSHRSSSNRRQGSFSARRGSSQTSPALGLQTESSASTVTPDPSTGGGVGESTSASRHGSRDDTSYYQAESAALTRENQMLRLRIRELGKSSF